MRVLFVLMVASLLFTLPFLALRKPWAVKLWRRAHIVMIVYAVAVTVAAIMALTRPFG